MNLISDKYVIITAVSEYLANVENLHELAELIDRAVNYSDGPADKDKLVRLNGSGQIDPSMIDASTFYYVGPFTPAAGNEYPDTTGETYGAFWVVQGLANPYTFVAGDLAGKDIDNGDFMVWGTGGWSIMRGEMNPMLYYKLDGSQPITDPFQAGANQLKDLADGTDPQDAVTMKQLNDYAPPGGGSIINDIPANITVGGVSSGTIIPAGTTFEEIFNMILIKLMLPYIIGYESIGGSLSGINSLYEVGDHIVGKYNINIQDGLIKSRNGTPDVSLKGGHDPASFTGDGIDVDTGDIDDIAENKVHTFQVSVKFLEGTAPYFDSEGNAATNLDSFRNEEVKTETRTTEGIYPQFYGMSPENYFDAPDGLYTALHKDVSVKTVPGIKLRDITGVDNYIYFVLPVGFEITKILDGNGFNVTNSFTAQVKTVHTPNYDADFYIMKSDALTSVANQKYKIEIKTI